MSTGKLLDAWIEKENKTSEIIGKIVKMQSDENIDGFTTEQTNIIKALAYRLSKIANKSESWPLTGHDKGYVSDRSNINLSGY